MRRYISYKYLTVMTIFVVMAQACVKTSYTETEVVPVDVPISFNTGIETKALFEPDNFHTAGNQIKVYDKHMTDDGQSTVYIDGAIAECTDGALTGSGDIYWPFKDRTHYWTKTGTHSFTAHSQYNATDDSLAPNASYGDDESLTIKNWTINLESQFDFLYARHTRSMAGANPYLPVPLQMQHLLTAIQFNVTNLTYSGSADETNYYLAGLTVSGAYDTGTATIAKGSVSGNTTNSSVTTVLSKSGNDISVSYDQSSRIPLYYGNSNKHNIFADKGKVGNDGFILMWPHDRNRLAELTATISYWEYDQLKTKEFKLNTVSAQWLAGRKYIYNIEISDNNISFTVSVVDWVYDDIFIEE